MTTIEPQKWENYAYQLNRIKVDGGHLYRCLSSATICFVPDIDLQRYQAHLRDAYKKGYADGQEDAKNDVVNLNESPCANEIVNHDQC